MNNEKDRRTIAVSPDLHRKLKLLAATMDVSIPGVIAAALASAQFTPPPEIEVFANAHEHRLV